MRTGSKQSHRVFFFYDYLVTTVVLHTTRKDFNELGFYVLYMSYPLTDSLGRSDPSTAGAPLKNHKLE